MFLLRMLEPRTPPTLDSFSHNANPKKLPDKGIHTILENYSSIELCAESAEN
jgi:hypothetical protein